MPPGVGGGAWHKYSEKQGDRDGLCGGHLFCLLWRPCDLPKSLYGGEASWGEQSDVKSVGELWQPTKASSLPVHDLCPLSSKSWPRQGGLMVRIPILE